MNRWLRPVLVLFAVVAAFCITFVWPKQNGLNFDIDTSPRAQAAKTRVPYDLSQVRVLKAVITKVNQNYVEPDRIDHRKMLLAGLNAIQGSVPPVIVHYESGEPTFKVQVNDQWGEFHVDDVNSPWSLTWRFQEVFRFLQKHLEQDEDIKLREVEYAAVNGMLRTLDPHSVLLTPDEYSEMQLSTRGEFGGLGIVISIREDQLTVIRPMPGTPAARAGLKSKDRIVKIDEESTVNMPLEEAVQRLRGTPGSSVAVWTVREGAKGWQKPKRNDLVRAVIHVESVESRMLADGIGYVKLTNFQANTCDDIEAALAKLHKDNLKGLVLDLRDNPGGLLQQAVCVADLFLSSGTIVTTSSNDPEKAERKLARAEGTEPNYPMVVLQNGGSASASEIVSGALKNHDRTLIVGERTFGKGSVQVLYSDDNDGWALKLTIAQYLTPGDVSIQGVGIVPDVEIEPMTVDSDDIDLFEDTGYLRESDLAAHLTHVRAHDGQKPAHVVRYYLPVETRERLREARPEDLEENEREDEFLTRFARELLAEAKHSGRRELLRDADPVIEATRAKEMGRAEAELRKIGVDWSEGEDQGPSQVAVTVTTEHKDNIGIAGQPFDLKVTVENQGKAPLYRLRATTKSDNRLFSERELVFGKLLPGERRTWSTTLGICKTDKSDKTDQAAAKRECRLPQTLRDRADGVRIVFDENHGHVPPPAEIRTRVQALDVPQFAYTVHVADDGRGNGDGQVQVGEIASVYMRVRNVGKGLSKQTVANLRNLSGAGILLHAGRFQLQELKPGQEAMVTFKFEVLPDFHETEAKLEVSVVDELLREAAGQKLVIPIAKPTEVALEAGTGTAVARSGAQVFERPQPGSKVIAQVQGGPLTLPVQSKLGEFSRVDLGQGRPGWINERDLRGGAGKGGHLVDVLAHMPPHLEVDYGGTLVTKEPLLRLKGRAVDDSIVRDLYIFVGSHKVFYKSNRKAAEPRKVAFDTTIPLRPGINYVTAVAREDNEVIARQTFIVRRDAPDGALMETPKESEQDFYELMEGGGGEE
jgi:carboxyl-terminal processing protease